MNDTPTTTPFPLLYADELMQRNQAKELRLHGASLRIEAKGLEPAKAKALRQEAKKLSEQAYVLRESAKAIHKSALQGLEAAAAEMTRRMPAEFAVWGAMKTRGYAKLLAILATQASRIHPNLQLASRAFDLLCSHSEWSDEQANRLGSLPKSPKSLP